MEEFIHIEPMPLGFPDLQKLIRYCNTLSFGKASIIENNQDINVHNYETRNVGSYIIGDHSALMTDVFWANLLEAVCKKIHKEVYFKKFKNFPIQKFEFFEILKYEKDHKFKVHIDHGSKTPRTLSFIYNLNNDYEGGDLLFYIKDKTFKAPKNPNQLIIFPSNGCYPHEVTPITKGTRYSIVSWAL